MTTLQAQDASIPACQQATDQVFGDKTEKLSTRLTQDTAQRLRLCAALRGAKISDLVGNALDRYLPTCDQLAEDFARATSPQTRRVSKENH
jgi:hypothetical protein